ncbi:LacI family DNA-binding transcriptional regulator [Azospirillum canadense]|uniref:LacI family DNA-binding transcriptional regulator n=1 Tax=Azospirillum canadense TaxID=403962 RepID=UPI002227759E|nr:LacI family DNA-binding transcriptional regulator [Azospirillum canadense]MCW2242353.1 LacI family transcriptional regulator [Azospirillum canadense]
MAGTTGNKRRVTIKDVAEECGLALSTVSNALTNKSYVTDETRRKVQETAARLGYRASAIARGLRINRTSAIGVLVADVANPSVVDHLRGIDDVTTRENLSVVLCNTDDSEARQIMLMQTLRDRQVDGMLLLSQHCRTPAVRAQLDGVPFVLMHRRCREFPDPYVGTDNRQAVEVAMQHLIDLGHSRIAFVCGPHVSSTVQERLHAYHEIVRRSGLDTDERLVVGDDYGIEAGHKVATELFALDPRPTAVIAGNDMTALGIIEVARERGIRIPADMSLVGADDIPFAKFSGVDLTTTRPPRRKMGVRVAEMLIRLIEGEDLAAEAHIFATELVVRGSTGAPTAATRRTRRRSRIS